MAVRSSEPPAYCSTIELNFSPRPVSVTTPTMIPAPAHVAATFSTPSEPPESALIRPEFQKPLMIGARPVNTSYGIRAVSRRRKLVMAETTVAQNTDSTGEKPHSMKTTIEISDRKWNQYFFVRLQAPSTRSKVTSF